MQKKMKNHEEHHWQPHDLETNCNICTLKKMDLCPYLEEVAKCHMFNNLEDQKVFKGIIKEKRYHPRKAILAPTLIKKFDLVKKTLGTGAIVDISLGGVRITMPKDVKSELLLDPQAPKFKIIFMLPTEMEPIDINCKLLRVVDSKDHINVGASIIDADSRSYKALATYLM